MAVTNRRQSARQLVLHVYPKARSTFCFGGYGGNGSTGYHIVNGKPGKGLMLGYSRNSIPGAWADAARKLPAIGMCGKACGFPNCECQVEARP